MPYADHAAAETDIRSRVSRILTKRIITASYTLVSEDAIDRVLHSTSGTALTITLTLDGSPIIPQEIAIPWRQYGAGQITFVPATADVVVISRGGALKSAGQYAEGVVTKVAISTWLVSGDLVA